MSTHRLETKNCNPEKRLIWTRLISEGSLSRRDDHRQAFFFPLSLQKKKKKEKKKKEKKKKPPLFFFFAASLLYLLQSQFLPPLAAFVRFVGQLAIGSPNQGQPCCPYATAHRRQIEVRLSRICEAAPFVSHPKYERGKKKKKKKKKKKEEQNVAVIASEN